MPCACPWLYRVVRSKWVDFVRLVFFLLQSSLSPPVPNPALPWSPSHSLRHMTYRLTPPSSVEVEEPVVLGFPAPSGGGDRARKPVEIWSESDPPRSRMAGGSRGGTPWGRSKPRHRAALPRPRSRHRPQVSPHTPIFTWHSGLSRPGRLRLHVNNAVCWIESFVAWIILLKWVLTSELV